MKTTIGTSRSAGSFWISLEQLEAGDVGQPQVEHDAVERAARAARASASAPVPTVVISTSSCAISSTMLMLLGRVVLDDQQLRACAAAAKLLDAVERRLEAVGRERLVEVGERAALEAVLALLLDGDDLHRDVARRRVLLELAQHRPAEHVGQEDVERDRGRHVLARERERLARRAWRRGP